MHPTYVSRWTDLPVLSVPFPARSRRPFSSRCPPGYRGSVSGGDDPDGPEGVVQKEVDSVFLGDLLLFVTGPRECALTSTGL